MSTNCERRRDLGAVQLAGDLFIFDERSKLLRALRATEYEPFATRRTSSRNVVQPHCSAAVGTRRRFTNRLFG